MRLGGAALLLILGCPQQPPAPRSPTDPPPPREGTTPCGPRGEHFADYEWIPADARLAGAIDLRDSELADALAALAATAKGDGNGLPIDASFSLSQWEWAVPGVVATLGKAGFEPAELVAARVGDVPAWFWASSCDLDEASQRVSRVWGVSVRRTATGVVGSAASGFPFDVAFLPGDRAALVPAGRGAAFVGALTRTAAREGPEAPPPVGAVLSGLAAAPVRVVVRGRGLIDPEQEAGSTEHRVRATAHGVEIDSEPVGPPTVIRSASEPEEPPTQ